MVVPLHGYLVREIRPTLYLLWGGVAFVLLIGGVNVTNLMLVRSSARMKELATRHALGAGIGRIARQLLTETDRTSRPRRGSLGLGLGMDGPPGADGASASTQTPQGTTVALDGTGGGVHASSWWRWSAC